MIKLPKKKKFLKKIKNKKKFKTSKIFSKKSAKKIKKI